MSHWWQIKSHCTSHYRNAKAAEDINKFIWSVVEDIYGTVGNPRKTPPRIQKQLRLTWLTWESMRISLSCSEAVILWRLWWEKWIIPEAASCKNPICRIQEEIAGNPFRAPFSFCPYLAMFQFRILHRNCIISKFSRIGRWQTRQNTLDKLICCLCFALYSCVDMWTFGLPYFSSVFWM